MQSPIRDSLRLLVLATALAGSLPGTAAAGDGTSKAAASTDASCKVPAVVELRLPAAPPASLGPAVHGLAGEARQARAEGIQPLNSRGHNYDSGRTGMDAAALDFESGAK